MSLPSRPRPDQTHLAAHAQPPLISSVEKLPAEQRAAPSEEEVSSVDPDDVSEEEIVADLSPPLKRRQQRELFEARLASRQEEVVKEVEEDFSTKTPYHEASVDKLIKLIAPPTEAAVHDPREYQLELFERAKKQNVIAVLDTGSGKTLIAVLLLKHVIEEELENRANGKPHRISFFLVDNVTLVYQQAHVLEKNIAQPIEKFCGAMQTDLWNKDTWVNHYKNNMIIVCTAEVLLQCLVHSFIRLEQINLLIFDEAHHAKKDHPYARIMKDFYGHAPKLLRPRVFGMTASPLDARTNVAKAAEQLESILHSRIATASNLSLLQMSVTRASEETWVYDPLPPRFKTALYKELHSRYGNVRALQHLFQSSYDVTATLGPWCADQVFKYGISNDVLPRLFGRAAMSKIREENATDDEDEQIREAAKMVEAHRSEELTLDNISPKVRLLQEKLAAYFERPTDTKCIVFVETRHTARILCELFKRIGTKYIRPGVLVGMRSQDPTLMNITFRELLLTLLHFRKGEVNCLFATSVAEEGLDIPDCNLIIRFDLCSTLIQYVQSRGRARHRNSVFAHLIEKNNWDHQRLIEEVTQTEQLMNLFCQTLPAECKVDLDTAFENIMVKERGRRSYKIESTGAKLTYDSAPGVLAYYASSLRHKRDDEPPEGAEPGEDGDTSRRQQNALAFNVQYVMTSSNGTFICEAILPERSPVRGGMGHPFAKKSLARKSAAFYTCLRLKKAQMLDDHWVSTIPKRRVLVAKVSIQSKKTNEYSRLTKPLLWGKDRGIIPTILYATLIYSKASKPLRHDAKPLVMLTRQAMPNFPSFPIFLDNENECQIRTTSFSNPITISEHDLQCLTTFTLRTFRDAFHKVYARQPEMLSYWLAPSVVSDPDNIAALDPRDTIDWNLMSAIDEGPEEIEYSSDQPPEYYQGRFLYDKWDGRFRYYTGEVDPSLRPSDPPPSSMARRRNMDTIMSYCLSLFKKSQERFMQHCDWNQPVYKAELLTLRRNLLDRPNEKEKKQDEESHARYSICVQPLRISAIPMAFAATIFMFPSIITRLESYLIALEACEKYGLKVYPDLALESITKDSYSDDQEYNEAEQVQLQRGMGKNYERLEFLGDCYLKMGTTIALYCLSSVDQESDLHIKRIALICNRRLFETAKKTNLYEYVRTRGLSRRGWYPEGLQLLQGKTKESPADTKHRLADKSVADVCEALIGASLLSGGPNHKFDTAAKAVSAFVDDKAHTVTSWSGYYDMYKTPAYQVGNVDASMKEVARQVGEETGYHFKYPRLLYSAFTHPSYPEIHAKVPCYQRLEFLGDSLFDMVCVNFLYANHPDKDPQWLTEHKMAMVSNKFLSFISVRLGFNKHLQLFNPHPWGRINSYIDDLKRVIEETEDAPDAFIFMKDPPKALADIVEAFVGAIFVDSGFKYEVVEDFFEKFIRRHFENMSYYDEYASSHPVTHMHRRLDHDFGCHNHCILSGPLDQLDTTEPKMLSAVFVHNHCIAEGIAASTRYASTKAGEKALKALEGLPAFRFREQYGCDCTHTKDE